MFAILCPVVIVSCTTTADPPANYKPVTIYVEKANVTPIPGELWVYYSIDGDSVTPSMIAADGGWDIKMAAFQGAIRPVEVLLNSGSGGPGATVGVVLQDEYDRIKAIPAGTALQNEDVGVSRRIVSLDLTGSGMFTFDPVNNQILPNPAQTLILRTGNGSYAKLQFTSVYKNMITSASASDVGYYHFRYVKSDTTSFE